jgi:hypothetical protein
VCDRHAFTYDYEILSGVYLCALTFGVFFLFGAGFFFFSCACFGFASRPGIVFGLSGYLSLLSGAVMGRY